MLMSRKKLAIRGYVAVFTATTLSIAAIALIATGALNPATYLAGRYQKELRTAPDDKVPFNLQRIAKLGEAGIPILVEALASSRSIVAESARQVLKDQLSLWRLESEARSTSKISLLAENLAKHVDSFGAVGRRAAGELTTEILIWPVNTQNSDNGRLITNCEIVIRAISEQIASNAGNQEPASTETLTPIANEFPISSLPPDIVRIPSLPVKQQRGVDVEKSIGSASSTIPPVEFTIENSNIPKPLALEPSTVEEPRESQSRQDETSRPSPTTVAIDRLDDVSLMRRLRLADASQAYAAAEELANRGYSEDDFQLALQLTSPDPKQRIALVSDLPRLTGVDSRKWLAWLSYDENAEVRRAAVSILATSTDPTVQTHLRRIAERESDPEVLRLIQQR